MRYWYDTEFLEQGNGHPIIPISIGIVAEDGRKFYAVVNQTWADWDTIYKHEWLRKNVVPHLPLEGMFINPHSGEAQSKLNAHHSSVFYRDELEGELRSFFEDASDWKENGVKAELWAYYSAYDHVVLAQMFGTMMDMPLVLPWYTHDIKTLAEYYGNPSLPKQQTPEHHALNDAEHDYEMWKFLSRYAEEFPSRIRDFLTKYGVRQIPEK